MKCFHFIGINFFLFYSVSIFEHSRQLIKPVRLERDTSILYYGNFFFTELLWNTLVLLSKSKERRETNITTNRSKLKPFLKSRSWIEKLVFTNEQNTNQTYKAHLYWLWVHHKELGYLEPLNGSMNKIDTNNGRARESHFNFCQGYFIQYCLVKAISPWKPFFFVCLSYIIIKSQTS